MLQEDFMVRLLADWLVVPIIFIAFGAALRIPVAQWYSKGSQAFFTCLLALFFAKIMSLFYQGERPFMTLGQLPGATYLDNPGFPSDHSLLVFSITVVVWASTHNKYVSCLLLVLSVMVAMGRVLALVHTPLDVIGGCVAAVLAGLCVYGWRLRAKV